ncbi:hypothetical protein BBO99_00008503 [Phytophthora kernoviae]|uniref:Uncharacterized protein n=2 Tax=Phytophthora kernoviae TaxID=325452 RepID=A0A3R7J431_9STRA|nr:hypothetical protein G195_009963 [Phytophthora kernoviae 00238/432]KAG2511031.1 hypothetical protein JM16_008276 [Phytophthora kernoviae]KAG2514593.1 hypothetical protein JM18_008303 [Phytophthora kernoviae]RLN15342.1 hypothetical protein BBI17_008734 [Phytophthora kernoviae]RLN75180.1 hypothetical protein BBO99_00008503 [Phytophthora kernoviae]
MRKRKNKSARARDAKRQKLLVVDAALYDKVLVDAECTHDGSIRHLQRMPGTVRFTPSQNTSGLFIARIRKAKAVALPSQQQ